MELSKELVITKELNAPKELVFKAFTEAEHLIHWWGPKGFSIKVAKLELKKDGVFLYSMKTPDGHEMWGKFIYLEIVAQEKIVFVNSFSDENGGIIRHPMSQTWPLQVINTLTLTEENGKTTLKIVGNVYNGTEEEIKTFGESTHLVEQGFNGTFGQLEAYLATL